MEVDGSDDFPFHFGVIFQVNHVNLVIDGVITLIN